MDFIFVSISQYNIYMPHHDEVIAFMHEWNWNICYKHILKFTISELIILLALTVFSFERDNKEAMTYDLNSL